MRNDQQSYSVTLDSVLETIRQVKRLLEPEITEIIATPTGARFLRAQCRDRVGDAFIVPGMLPLSAIPTVVLETFAECLEYARESINAGRKPVIVSDQSVFYGESLRVILDPPRTAIEMLARGIA